MNKRQQNDKYVKLGFTIFFSLTAVILVYLGLSNIKIIHNYVSVVISALQPILIGLILGYLVAPLETKIELFLLKKKLKRKPAQMIAVFLTTVFILIVLILLIWILLPQVIKTVLDLSVTLPGMLTSFTNNLNEWVHSDSKILEFVDEAIKRFNTWFTQWMQSGIYETLTSLVSGILNAFGFVLNVVIGFIVMIYVLFEKDHFRGQAKKILYSISKDRKVNAFILDTVRQCDRMFGGFITGKLIDSLIIGVLCFICMTIMKFPYVALISLIVGITNIIPFFGPYIGAIPSAFLILLTDPMKCVEFVIFILILQQFDGNILGPRILGQSTGLSSFWVLFSILIFGELFGVVGMIIGVPLFGTIYYVIKRLIEAGLKKQNLPIETRKYVALDKLDENNCATYLTESKTSHRKKKETKQPVKEQEDE